MARFKLLAGRYVEGKGDNRRTYKPGDFVDSTLDLVAKFGRNKFELVNAPRFELPRAGKKGQQQQQNLPGTPPEEVAVAAPPQPPPPQSPQPKPQGPKSPTPKPQLSQEEVERLNRMSIADLQKAASQEGIETRGLRSKEALVAALKKAREEEMAEDMEDVEEESEEDSE